MALSKRDRFTLFAIFILVFILLVFQYAGGNPEYTWPDSDSSVFPLTAIHLMQGEEFPWYFYEQDYIGTLPVLIIWGLFSVFGQSHLWVDFLYAAVYAGITTLIAAFIIRRIGPIPTLVFAFGYALFPTILAIPRALDSGTHNFSLLLGFASGYLFSLFWQYRLNKQAHKLLNSPLTISMLLILCCLTYWSSPLGMVYLTAIVAIVVISSRNHTALINDKKILLIYQHYFSEQWRLRLGEVFNHWHWLILVTVLVAFFLIFDKALFNLILIYDIYFYHLFSRIDEPFNFIWIFSSLVVLIAVIYRERETIMTMVKGDVVEIPWHLVILFVPVFNMLVALPTFEYLVDFTSARYFESLQWIGLIAWMLFISYFGRKNFTSILFILILINSWYSEDIPEYQRLLSPKKTAEFIQQRHDDRERLIKDEKMLIDFLEQRKLYYGFADYWLAYRLTYLSHERFIISSYYESRYPKYDDLIKENGVDFYLFNIDELGEGREVAEDNGKNNGKIFGNLILFY